MNEIIKQYDLTKYDFDLLLYENKIIKQDNDNKYWYASIFPKSSIKEEVNFIYRKDRIITTIDDNIFTDMGFIILTTENEIIVKDNKRSYIKSQRFGNFNDSIKRYTNLNKPININNDTQDFLNIPKPSEKLNKIDVISKELIFKVQEDMSDILPKPKPDIFEDHINHPFINKVKLKQKPFKFNSKDYIIEILKWAKEKDIKYIYCINEHRSYIENKKFVAPYVYYTIKGF